MTVVAKLALDEDSPSDSVLATLPDGAKIDIADDPLACDIDYIDSGHEPPAR